MLFIATLSHDPADCWVREENEAMGREWIASLDDRAEENDIELHGAYVTPNEHRFYMILDADTFEAVTKFLGSPFLPDHDGHVAPVLELREGVPEAFGGDPEDAHQ